MKYLKRFLETERQAALPSVLSVPLPGESEFSEEEEGVKKGIYRGHLTAKADRSPFPSVLSVPAASVSSVSTPEVCSWCGAEIVTIPGVLTLARRTPFGDVLHPKCWAESTKLPDRHLPNTPRLDHLLAQEDQQAEDGQQEQEGAS